MENMYHSNGQLAYDSRDGEVIHSNGQRAYDPRDGELYHDNGQRAWDPRDGEAYHSNGRRALDPRDGECYHSNGSSMGYNGIELYLGEGIRVFVSKANYQLYLYGVNVHSKYL